MAQSRETFGSGMNAFTWSSPPLFGAPMISLFVDLNGRMLQTFVSAQKDWADFIQRRVNEDISLSHQLMGCNSLADMHETYSRYLRRAFEQYQEQSQRAVHRLQSATEDMAETTEARGREAQRARH